jgi:hypothetical protein
LPKTLIEFGEFAIAKRQVLSMIWETYRQTDLAVLLPLRAANAFLEYFTFLFFIFEAARAAQGFCKQTTVSGCLQLPA